MERRSLAQDVRRWAIEEMGLSAHRAPTEEVLQRLFIGQCGDIWKYIIHHVFSQGTVKKVEGNLLWYQQLERSETQRSVEEEQRQRRKQVCRKILDLRQELQHLQDQIHRAELEVAGSELNFERSQDLRRQLLMLEAFRKKKDEECRVMFTKYELVKTRVNYLRTLQKVAVSPAEASCISVPCVGLSCPDVCMASSVMVQERYVLDVYGDSPKEGLRVYFELGSSLRPVPYNTTDTGPLIYVYPEPVELINVRDICRGRSNFLQSLYNDALFSTAVNRGVQAQCNQQWRDHVQRTWFAQAPNHVLAALKRIALESTDNLKHLRSSLVQCKTLFSFTPPQYEDSDENDDSGDDEDDDDCDEEDGGDDDDDDDDEEDGGDDDDDDEEDDGDEEDGADDGGEEENGADDGGEEEDGADDGGEEEDGADGDVEHCFEVDGLLLRVHEQIRAARLLPAMPVSIPTFQSLLKEGWEDSIRVTSTLHFIQSQVEQSSERLSVVIQDVQKKISDKGDIAALTRAAFDTELRAVIIRAYRDGLELEAQQLQHAINEKKEEAKVLQQKQQMVDAFCRLLMRKQNQLQILLTESIATTDRIKKLHEEVTSFMLKLRPLPQQIFRESERLRDAVGKEVKHFSAIFLPSLQKVSLDGATRISKYELSINRISNIHNPNNCIYEDLFNYLKLPVFKAPECLLGAVADLKKNTFFMHAQMTSHMQAIRNLQRLSENHKSPGSEVLLKMLADHYAQQTDCLVPKLQFLIQQCQKSQEYGKDVQAAITDWWEQPAQQCLPEEQRGGLTLQQWRDRWAVAAAALQRISGGSKQMKDF